MSESCVSCLGLAYRDDIQAWSKVIVRACLLSFIQCDCRADPTLCVLLRY